MKSLSTVYPISLYIFASPTYWPDAAERRRLANTITRTITSEGNEIQVRTFLIDSDASLAEVLSSTDSAAVFCALSGGVQAWMTALAEKVQHPCVFNAYLPGTADEPVSAELLHANAHPASTDFFAHQRLAGKNPAWITTREELTHIARAWQGVRRLQQATVLKIGETEPWVINSCRDPEVIRTRIGTQVIALERDELYAEVRAVANASAQQEAQSWLDRANSLVDVASPDVITASAVTVAMQNLLERYEADGLSMACFAMIGDIDTTSCLALSALNASANRIGACEGDLDAALTQLLLKASGADFVWIANPIIGSGKHIDLVHCTAPTCSCQGNFPFRLMRHHESGRGVAPEVELPSHETASICRLSVNASTLVAHQGETLHVSKLPACHTQLRLTVESTQGVLDSLMGTHFVLSYGHWLKPLEYASRFLGLKYHATDALHD